MTLTFTERYRQARLYAAQVRVRRAMGDKYAHATPYRRPADDDDYPACHFCDGSCLQPFKATEIDHVS